MHGCGRRLRNRAVQHHALVQIGARDLGQHFWSDFLAPAEVLSDCAVRDPELLCGHGGVRANGRLFRLVPTTPLRDQPLPLKNLLPPDVVVGPLGVGQFGAGEVLFDLPKLGVVFGAVENEGLDAPFDPVA